MKLKPFLLLIALSGVLRADEVPAPAAAPAPSPEIGLAEASVQGRSLWEAGVIGADLYQPDYPAAGQKHAKWLAAPYLIYRGRILRADREGARARLVRGRWADVEMSFAASFATRSKDNDARTGMPDLDYLLEMGPRVSVLLSRLDGRGSLRLFLPARAVFSTDLSNLKHRGFTYSPALYAQVEPFWRSGWIGLMQLAGRFGDRQINAYFYDVAPEFARPDRPAYDARAGYLGSDLFAGVAIPMGRRWRLFTGGQLYFDGGSANSASPLFKRRTDYSVGLGLSYALYFSHAPAQP